MEIKLKKRYKYAGDVYAELIKNAFTPSYVSELIDKVPDADVAPVVHGKWISRVYIDTCGADWTSYCCSLCGRIEIKKEPYCHCGAKMDLEV